MRKKSPKLALSRETLRSLDGTSLNHAAGAATISCESCWYSCPGTYGRQCSEIEFSMRLITACLSGGTECLTDLC